MSGLSWQRGLDSCKTENLGMSGLISIRLARCVCELDASVSRISLEARVGE
jgi:hypothetical protein